MALHFVPEGSEAPVLSAASCGEMNHVADLRVRSFAAAIKWRQSILGIVADCVVQIERCPENEDFWRLEAQQRALNFAGLGLGEISAWHSPVMRTQRPAWNIAAVAALGGGYRLLGKCEGPAPIRCERLFQNFLTNLVLAHAPVCGNMGLALDFCAAPLAPRQWRALILCTGMLIQAMLRQPCRSGFGRGLEVRLSADRAQYSLGVQLHGRRIALARLPEFDLALLLCRVLEGELVFRDAEGGAAFVLHFPVPA